MIASHRFLPEEQIVLTPFEKDRATVHASARFLRLSTGGVMAVVVGAGFPIS